MKNDGKSMKKDKKVIVLVFGILLVLAVAVGVLLWMKNAKPTWYDVNAEEFTITTAEELYDIAELSETYDFSGQTIKLGADIVVNEGDASEWSEKAPKRRWHPITGFAGTFDGQGYSISGIYGDGIVTSMGLFTDTKKSAVIRDFQLLNSYFKNGNDKGTGSIIGFGGGTLESVYSDAIIEGTNNYFGGLIGKLTVKAENKISNCWFDGSITMKGTKASYIGGLVGSIEVADAMNLIEHSLNTGDLSSEGSQVGGICGSVSKGGFLRLDDSMSTGIITYAEDAANVGSVLGQIDDSSSAFIADTYTVKEIKKETIGTTAGNLNGNVISKNEELLTGFGGYQWTTLDFDNYWAVKTDDTPVLMSFAMNVPSLAGIAKKIDMSWYDSNKNEFVITTAEELYGFAFLSISETFAGKTIKLGADITINEGNAEDWADTPPTYDWSQIGWHGINTGQHFTGTFDGQGYTISGIYIKGDENEQYIGLFGEVYRTGVIKNFKITNSYFEGTRESSKQGIVGSVAGRVIGTMDTVYSDAIVVSSSKFTGGLSGMIVGDGENTITNCWFDGEMYATTNSGGILGGVYGNKKNITGTIEHCLNTGTLYISDDSTQIGGLCGIVQQAATLNLTDSLNAGEIVASDTVKKVGSAVGAVAKDSGGTSYGIASSVYGINEFSAKTIGYFNGEWTGHCANVKEAFIKGNGGYQFTTLDFKNYWAIRKNDTPVLASFAASRPSVSGITRMIDVSWYSEGKKTFTLTTAAQLYGFAQLSKTYSFEGQTIKLGKDITLNKGDASEWATNAPANVWTPIGWQGPGIGQHFMGTFDGQGHTISGIYVKGAEDESYLGLFGEIYRGASVKNLNITNSYIERTGESSVRGCAGSLAGRALDMTVSSVYSDAIVVNGSRMTGGLIAMITDDGTSKITNCWFDGEIHGYSNSGGILGGVYGNKKEMTVTIEHCLNTGDFYISDGATQIGGLCGVVQQKGVLYLTDCLNAGTIETTGTVSKIGNAIGAVAKDTGGISYAEISKVYGLREFAGKAVGYCNGEKSVAEVTLLNKKYLSGYHGYQFTKLDFKNYWIIQAADATPVLSHFTGSEELDLTGVVKADTSWYDEDGKTFTINTVAELYGFTVLSKTYDFSEQTVKLGKDITLNKGSAEDLAENASVKNMWMPIGWQGSGVHFKGTFDGQGHTISGICVKGAENESYLGLFGEIYRGASVKNLKLTNSYIERTGESSVRGCVGSLAGRALDMTVSSVYSDAIVVNGSRMTGGLIGMVTDDGTNKITNCWFDGEIHGFSNSGGILGGIYGNKKEMTVTIEHCLNTGDFYISDGATQIGGLCGVVQQKGVLYLTDSLNTGTIETTGTVSKIGNAIGAVAKDTGGISYAEISKVYGAREFARKAVGYCNGEKSEAGIVLLNEKYLAGYDGYRYMQLDYKNYWVIQEVDATPVLSHFAGSNQVDMTDVVRADASWYSEDGKSFTIKTAEELYGLTLLSKVYDFEGQTIKLGSNIIIDLSEKNMWMPIGYQNAKTGAHFKGTFDGQGYTIRGICVKGDESGEYLGLFGEIYRGATVKNLSIKDSYIEGTLTSTARGCVGSLAGRALDATIDSVYSNAILVNSARMTGGIVGMITDDGNSKITNCWYDGELYGSTNSGGMVGSIYGNKKEMTVTIENCLNTGAFHISDGSTQIGGFCGVVQQKGYLTLKNSLNAGTITATGTISKVGNAIGAVAKDSGGISIAKLSNVHGIKEFAKKAVAYCNAEMSEVNSILLNKEYLSGYDGYRYAQLDFDKYWVVQNTDATPVLSLFAGKDRLDTKGVVKADISWYSEEGKSFTIKTAEEFYGLTLLSKAYDFEGQTIKLGADIQINEADDYASNPPVKNEWMPIGYQSATVGVHFKGTLDGQGNTISGIYVKGDDTEEYLGLFGEIYRGATVKNLVFTDSYIEGTRANSLRGCVGSLAGRALDMTIDSVYSDAILVNSANKSGGTGGLVGMITDDGNSKITNSWYAGSLYGMGNSGGLVGLVYGNNKEMTVTIEHCLNTGALTIGAEDVTCQHIGGICGAVSKGGVLKITDSLNTGSYKKNGTVTRVGNAIGIVAESCLAELTKAYGITDFGSRMVWICDGEMSEEDSSVQELDSLKGYEGQRVLKLDFANYWVTEGEEATPVLLKFAGNDRLDTSVIIEPDTTWYEANKESKEFTITKAEELYGLAELSRTEDFTGWLITLGNDIPLNNKTVDEMTELPPANVWTPIGYYKEGTGPEFQGTFDGNNHTISGIYAVTNEEGRLGLFGTVGADGVVKNLQISESYFENTSGLGSGSYTGSVTGVLHGTLDTIKSTALICSNSQYNGGLVGGIIDSEESDAEVCLINNCWFAGRIESSNQKTAGILGGINGAKATISHCFNTGTISMTATSSQQFAGLCGVVLYDAQLSITDSLNAGTFESVTDITKIGYIGSIIGLVQGKEDDDTKVSLMNVYGHTDTTSGTWRSAIYDINYADYDVNGDAGSVDDGKNDLRQKINGHAAKSLAQLSGDAAYLNTNLDFYHEELNSDGYWILVEDEVPVLRSFKESREAVDYETIEGARTAWYYPDNQEIDTYTIYTKAELYGFAELAKEHNFEGKTIQLGKDITLNEDVCKKVDSEDTTDFVQWTPIGKYADSQDSQYAFQGTFDGNNKTISGLYASTAEKQYLGLFGTVGADGVVKNFIIKDSYFQNTSRNDSGAYMGSVAAVLYGTLDSIKSEARLVTSSQYAGGMTGAMLYTDGGEYTINNCWFAGTITSDSQKVAGIVGGITGEKNKTDIIQATISHCLNSGTIYLNYYSKNYPQQCAGLCGVVLYDAQLEMTDCLSTKAVVLGEGAESTKNIGSVIGLVQGENTDEDQTSVNLMSVYAYTAEGVWNDTAITDINYADVKVNNEVINVPYSNTNNTELAMVNAYLKVDADSMKGENAYLNMNLDFCLDNDDEAGHWITVENATPILRSFKEDVKALNVRNLTDARTVWFNSEDAETAEYVIYTRAELYGLSELAQEHDFSGITIKLGESLNLEGSADAQWTPIGCYIDGEGKEFKGTFDGQNNTIRGIYIDQENVKWRIGLFGTVGAGGVVTNLKIEDSYFKNTSTASSGAYMGSVVGVLHGTVSNVYSSAELHSTSHYNGGIVGAILGSAACTADDYTVKNCWFVGEITCTNQKTAGIVGGINGNVLTSNISAEISYCLNSGTITYANEKTTGQQLGGICGVVANVTSGTALEMTECLNVGKLLLSGTATINTNNASVIGLISKASVKADNVYGYIGDGEEPLWSNQAIKVGTSGGTATNLTINGVYVDATGTASANIAKINAYAGKTKDQLTGDLNLDYVETAGKWFVKDGKPVLYSFKDESLWTVD